MVSIIGLRKLMKGSIKIILIVLMDLCRVGIIQSNGIIVGNIGVKNRRKSTLTECMIQTEISESYSLLEKLKVKNLSKIICI